MSVRTIFANESGNQPASQLDNMYIDVWNAATLSCTVTGTNALTLTPRTNVNLPTSYVPNQRVSFTAGTTSTGLMTAQIGALAALNIYQPGGTQAGAGNIVINTYYELAYDANLNTGSGGWWMVSATASTPTVAQPLQGGFKDLIITNTTAATAASQVTFTADQLLLWNAGGGAVTITSFSVTININASGANGLDTGSFTASTWYYIWAIYNPTTATAAGLFSTSPTAPTMPSGYTYKARYGAIRANATPAFQNMMQKGRRAQYVVGTYNGNALAALPIIGSGIIGTFSLTAPTLAATAVAPVVPVSASVIEVAMSNRFNGGSGPSNMLLAPNVSYSGANNGPNGINGMIYPAFLTGTVASGLIVPILLEGASLYLASDATGGVFAAFGWEDNL